RLVEAVGADNPMIEDGLLRKKDRPYGPYFQAIQQFASTIDDPRAPFDLRKLADQITNECVFEPRAGEKNFGGWTQNELG
ncbi:hypothetical protein PJI23_33675, partial [Mycobacterium kansasii]